MKYIGLNSELGGSKILYPLFQNIMVLGSIFFFPIQNLGIEQCGSLIKGLWLSLENHRTVRVGRDIWRFSHPAPLLTQGCLEPVVQVHV